MDREAAQARLNRIRTFNSELSVLQQDGVVTLDDVQRRAIADYHQQLLADLTARFDLDRDEGQQRMSLGMRVASILGAIALSAAVFLLFYRIWGRLSTTVQVVLLVGAPLVSVTLTEIAHRFDRTRHFVFVAAVIACACIVMNVALLGDIFAMTDSPNALAVWAAFALMIGYGYGLRLPVAVGLGLAIAFAAGSILSWQGIDWKMFEQRPELFLPLATIVSAMAWPLKRDRVDDSRRSFGWLDCSYFWAPFGRSRLMRGSASGHGAERLSKRCIRCAVSPYPPPPLQSA